MADIGLSQIGIDNMVWVHNIEKGANGANFLSQKKIKNYSPSALMSVKTIRLIHNLWKQKLCVIVFIYIITMIDELTGCMSLYVDISKYLLALTWNTKIKDA